MGSGFFYAAVECVCWGFVSILRKALDNNDLNQVWLAAVS